jgi:hypothetical protein
MNPPASPSCACPCHAGHAPDCACAQCEVRRCVLQCCGGETGKPQRQPCPPPPKVAQPGTVDVPQPSLFPPRVRPPATDRPQSGDPGEASWLSSQVQDMVRNGPRFGARKDEFLPYILVRSYAGDTGARGGPIPPYLKWLWHISPDICALPDTEADVAPLMPAVNGVPGFALQQVGLGRPATLYAHVWNLGKAAAFRVRVEFYAGDIAFHSPPSDYGLVGAAWVDLADRFTYYPQWIIQDGPSGQYLSRGNHVVVKCPQTWVPQASGQWQFVVRAFDPILDAIPQNSFASTDDRHVALQGATLVKAASPAQIDLPVKLGFLPYPADVTIETTRIPLAEVPWLPLLGPWAAGLREAQTPVIAGLLPPGPSGSRVLDLAGITPACRQSLLKPRESFHQGCDPLQIQFHASAADLSTGEAAVLQIQETIGDAMTGAHTVMLMRP